MKLETLELQAQIEAFIDKLDRKHGDILTVEVRSNMAKSLAEFADKSISKFLEGQKEHGGDLRQRNLDAEIEKEFLDLFWYREAKFWPSEFPAQSQLDAQLKLKLA